MTRALPRKLFVTKKEFVSANMLRITLGGDALNDFPEAQESGYLKLHFARPDILDADIEKQLLSNQPLQRPLLRTYTIRQQRYSPNQIDIDFVIHETGPASTWAANCSLADPLYIAGPGKIKLVNPLADWFLLVGDMTALPAISVNIEKLPANAKGYAVIEILHENDKQDLVTPDDFKIIWVIKNDNPIIENNVEETALVNQVKKLEVFAGSPSVWLACEFSSMRNLRQYFLKELNINKRDLYASSYWKIGANEDEHKKIKAMDANQ